MIWNWQKKGWPEFSFNASNFEELEKKFIEKAGMVNGSLLHIDAEQQEALKIELMSEEAFKTSEIEGEYLNRDSIQSSIRKHFGLQTDNRKIPPTEKGITEMMVNLFHTFDQPLNDETLFSWHESITYGRRDLLDIGKYRTHEDPMQIVSGPLGHSKVHFEAPPSMQVATEMQKFIAWFNESEKNLSTLVRSSIAHLYFESIHPFEDGNGRIGRAISEKALSQNAGHPILLALSHTIEKNKSAYYQALETYNKGLEIDGWIEFFSNIILKAQDHTILVIQFIIEKGKFYDRFRNLLNDRQLKVVNRIFREGVSGFSGGLSAKNYSTISGATSATTTRDLTKMVELGALTKTGQLKSTRYFLNIKTNNS
jgi:Fic family protein